MNKNAFKISIFAGAEASVAGGADELEVLSSWYGGLLTCPLLHVSVGCEPQPASGHIQDFTQILLTSLCGINLNQPVPTPRLHTDTFDFSVRHQPQPASAHSQDFTQILLTSLCGINLNQPVPTSKTSHIYTFDLTSLPMSLSGVMLLFEKQ